MIYEALSCLTDEINEYFRNKLRINEDKVVLSGIVNQDGTIAVQGENKIIVTLINTEKETAGNSSPLRGGGVFSNQAQPLNINLYVLFSAYFSATNYPESLRFLSFIIAYFQHKSVFNRSNTPMLDPKIEKLIFEIVDRDQDALSNMWSALGAKYMPSVTYRIRMLTFDESIIKEFTPAISGISSDNKIASN